MAEKKENIILNLSFEFALMIISAKEAEETEYWLLLCKNSKNYPFNQELLEKLLVIQKLLSKIISSSKKLT